MKLDSYGEGRYSVIVEMIDFCEKQIDKINAHGRDPDTHIAATMKGQKKSYQKTIQKLMVKKGRLKR
jgi:hypothetical protein